jgi:hypothetical protein
LSKEYLHHAMAEASGVTEATLKIKLVELLQATHVEIEDVSGTAAPLSFWAII